MDPATAALIAAAIKEFGPLLYQQLRANGDLRKDLAEADFVYQCKVAQARLMGKRDGAERVSNEK